MKAFFVFAIIASISVIVFGSTSEKNKSFEERQINDAKQQNIHRRAMLPEVVGSGVHEYLCLSNSKTLLFAASSASILVYNISTNGSVSLYQNIGVTGTINEIQYIQGNLYAIISGDLFVLDTQNWVLNSLINSPTSFIYDHVAIDLDSRIFLMEKNRNVIHYYLLFANGTTAHIGNLTFPSNVQGFLIFGQYMIVYEQYDVNRINLNSFEKEYIGGTGVKPTAGFATSQTLIIPNLDYSIYLYDYWTSNSPIELQIEVPFGTEFVQCEATSEILLCCSDIFLRLYNFTSRAFITSFYIPGGRVASQVIFNQNLAFVGTSNGLWTVDLTYRKSTDTPNSFFNLPGLISSNGTISFQAVSSLDTYQNRYILAGSSIEWTVYVFDINQPNNYFTYIQTTIDVIKVKMINELLFMIPYYINVGVFNVTFMNNIIETDVSPVTGAWTHVTPTLNGLVALFDLEDELYFFNISNRNYSVIPNSLLTYGVFATGNIFYGVTYGDVRVVDSTNINTIATNYLERVQLSSWNLRFSELIKNESYLLVGSLQGLHILECRNVFPRLRDKSFYPTDIPPNALAVSPNQNLAFLATGEKLSILNITNGVFNLLREIIVQDYITSVTAMPSMGTNCSLVVADFALGIKLFEIPNCVDISQQLTSLSMTSGVSVATGSFVLDTSLQRDNRIGLAAGVSVAAVVVIVAVVVVMVILLRRKNKEKSKEGNDIELATPMIRDLKIIEIIGRGNFGGLWNQSVVALKLLHDTNDNSLINEAAVLWKLNHPNIIRLFGIFQKDSEKYLVMEYMASGSLDHFLSNRTERLNQVVLLQMAVQITSGMIYLSEQNIVHRDLSLRNILIDVNTNQDYKVKISDFGMSRIVNTNSFYKANDGSFPVKWSPPEVISNMLFTTKSDIWSLGITLWELFSMGKLPYPGFSNAETAEAVVNKGYRMLAPPNCPVEIYNIMKKCWNAIPNERPTFSQILEEIIALLPLSVKSEHDLRSFNATAYSLILRQETHYSGVDLK